MNRSWLFVPADSERKLAKAAGAGADVLILDLEDSVMPERKEVAREMMRAHLDGLADRRRWWVRVNSLSSGELLTDLVATVPARPAGILLPKIFGPEDLITVEHYLDALEVQHDIKPGSIHIAVLVTETPAALLRLGELISQPHPRVSAVFWGAEDLSSAMGAGCPRDANGAWYPTYEFARTQALLVAHAWGVEAVDTVYVDFHSDEGLRASCTVSRHDGFTGRVAIHPCQVATINKAYSPSDDEVRLAQHVIDAFAQAAGSAGAVSIDGEMYDLPHLKAARRLLASAEIKHD